MDKSQENLRFGDYLTKRRAELEISLRSLANKLDITPAYLSDIERGRRNPPEAPLLEKMAKELMIIGDEKDRMFDLAGKGRNEVSPDLPDYIMASDVVRVALRRAKGVATEEDWLQFIKKLDEKGQQSD